MYNQPYLTLASDPNGLLIFGGVAVIIVVAIIWSVIHERKRREKLTAIAQQMGLSFDPKGTMPAGGFNHAPLFNLGRARRTKNVMSGQVEDVQLHLFDYQYTTGSGKHSSTHRYTVAALEVRNFNLPKFHLKPEHFGHAIAKLFGYDDIDFTDFPVFSKKYHLSGDNEDAVRSVFTPDVLAYFEENAKGNLSVEAWDSWLVLYRSGGRKKPNKWPTFLQDAFEVVNQLTTRAS